MIGTNGLMYSIVATTVIYSLVDSVRYPSAHDFHANVEDKHDFVAVSCQIIPGLFLVPCVLKLRRDISRVKQRDYFPNESLIALHMVLFILYTLATLGAIICKQITINLG